MYQSSDSAGAAGGYREHVDFEASPANVSIGPQLEPDLSAGLMDLLKGAEM